MRKKKDVVYGLLFLLHDFADLGLMNPIRNPTHVFWPKTCMSKCVTLAFMCINLMMPKCTMPSCYVSLIYQRVIRNVKFFIRIDATDQPVCNSVLLMW